MAKAGRKPVTALPDTRSMHRRAAHRTAARPRRARHVDRPDRSVLAWALRHGRPADADALAAILGARQEHAPGSTVWRAADLWSLLWVGVPSWCATHGVPVPDRVVETLWTLIDHLEATAQLDARSDAPAALRRAVQSCAGLDGAGRPRHAHAS